MPELRALNTSELKSIPIPWKIEQSIVIGTESAGFGHDNNVRGLLPKHATIIKMADSPAYTLLDHSKQAGSLTLVNHLPVTHFKVIRHGDQVSFGEQEYVFIEFQQDVVRADSQYLQEDCPFIKPHPYKIGDSLAVCRCGQASHLEHWLIAEKCPRVDCAYPHRDVLVKYLRSTFMFETIYKESALIGKRCNNPSGDYPWDKVPFREKDRIAYCPACKLPYHETCWLSLESCPTPHCGYNVREKILKFFMLGKEEVSVR